MSLKCIPDFGLSFRVARNAIDREGREIDMEGGGPTLSTVGRRPRLLSTTAQFYVTALSSDRMLDHGLSVSTSCVAIDWWEGGMHRCYLVPRQTGAGVSTFAPLHNHTMSLIA